MQKANLLTISRKLSTWSGMSRKSDEMLAENLFILAECSLRSSFPVKSPLNLARFGIANERKVIVIRQDKIQMKGKKVNFLTQWKDSIRIDSSACQVWLTFVYKNFDNNNSLVARHKWDSGNLLNPNDTGYTSPVINGGPYSLKKIFKQFFLMNFN